MVLPLDVDDEGYRFYKTLNEDIELIQDESGVWDMNFQNGDIVNLTGKDSLRNAICIAIMTRYKELQHNQLYTDFGCRIHELLKANKGSMTAYKMELYVEDVLMSMRRIHKVNEIQITTDDSENPYKYNVFFNVVSINDETVSGSLSL